MKKLMVINFIIAITVLNTCNDNPVIPEDKPGRRDYTWIVDTLNLPNNMSKIWGSSPNDIWAVCTPGSFSHSLYHFNGEDWTTDSVFRFLSPESIWGFSWDDVWIGGVNGAIWHYDGNRWSENAAITKNGSLQVVFDNMWGDKPDNLYAFGAYPDEKHAFNNSVIAHYTTNKWTMFNTNGLIGIVERFYKNKPDKNIYVQTYRIGGGEYPDSSLIYEYSEDRYKKISGSIWIKGLQSDLSIINGEVYFIMGNEIATRVNNNFKTVVTIDNPDFYQRIWGRNSKDIFLLMTDGLVHYNGSDMEYLFYFNKPRTQIFGAALFEKEVFFVVSEPQLNLIYHGILNE